MDPSTMDAIANASRSFTSAYDAILNVSRSFAPAYAYLYDQFQHIDLSSFPPPDQVMTTGSAVLQTVFGQTYQLIPSLPLQQANVLTLFLILVILYIFYCLFMAMLSWAWRLFYGFVRFSLLIAILAGVVYTVQQKMYEQ